MSRDLGTALSREVVKPSLNPFFAVELALDDPIRAWTGIGELSFGGHTWLGTGALGTVSGIGEDADGAATGVSVTLSGIDPSFEADLMEQDYRGKGFSLYVGALDEAFKTVAAGPKLLWKGRVDSVEVQDGDTLAITITAESRMRDQGRPRIRRYTDQEQRRRFPGDRFFEYLTQMVEVSILWGKA
ncbi:hypothetical protein BSL82_05650 [Tardibacter chloracetimidivorans]|uniref:Uncharacterized protein n=1 Tax=Tardibacter chloracetimidivorans TaxID=1921510 RepID=A0A1L3ZTA8_9SPHN|nr:hypothetical protein [Tardibacter chloracetimidivorans]API58857.1 hypothetical protein BSL82_05650 [Tardibacter chloracetimidivorans]